MAAFRGLLGERIRELREARGMSQVVFAKRALLSRETLRRIEEGRAALASDRLPRVAKELGVTVLELLAFTKDLDIPPLTPESPRTQSDS